MLHAAPPTSKLQTSVGPVLHAAPGPKGLPMTTSRLGLLHAAPLTFSSAALHAAPPSSCPLSILLTELSTGLHAAPCTSSPGLLPAAPPKGWSPFSHTLPAMTNGCSTTGAETVRGKPQLWRAPPACLPPSPLLWLIVR